MATAHDRPNPGQARRRAAARPGFTLIEATVTIGIIVLLASLVFVALTRALASARRTAERQNVVALRFAVDAFKNEFGFLPPLVDDANPIDTRASQPRTFTDTDLGNPADPSEQFSIYTIPYYLMGAVDDETADGAPLDGAVGPATSRVEPDGRFARRGKPIQAFFQSERAVERLVRDDGSRTGLVALLDRWGLEAWKSEIAPRQWPPRRASVVPGTSREYAVRFYRWKPRTDAGGAILATNIPAAAVTRPYDQAEHAALGGASYAIVSAGPDGLITDGAAPPPPRVGTPDAGPASANADNIVEIGR